jgi:hypothetical protein
MTDSRQPTRDSFEQLEVPPRPVREIAGEAVADINYAIQRLTQWSVRVPADSRLHQARGILAEAAETGTLIPRHRGDDLGLRALELAFDYAAIADTLPQATIASIRRELESSLVGPLDPPEAARGPQQLQAQFVVRAAFVRAGLSPSHPTPRPGVSNPDLLLENGASTYAIEVKRPKVMHNVVPRMIDARDQIADYGLPGGILVDVTDCLRGIAPDRVGDEVWRLALRLYDEVFMERGGFRQESSHIMVAGTFGRLSWETTHYESHAMVNVHTVSVISIFADARNTIRDRRARWIRSSFQNGLEQLYRTITERGKS